MTTASAAPATRRRALAFLVCAWLRAGAAAAAPAMLSAGSGHDLALADDGTVSAWGTNEVGQLGDGSTTRRLLPVRVALPVTVVAVAAGTSHSLALGRDGSVWSWGFDHAAAASATGAPLIVTRPLRLAGIVHATAIAAGGAFSLAVTRDGGVWAWGRNFSAELGDGTTRDRGTPARVRGIPAVTAVAAGADYALALARDGTVWRWGKDHDGTIRRAAAPIPGLRAIVAVAAGDVHSLALARDGHVLAWGRNYAGALGDGGATEYRATPAPVEGIDDVVAIAAAGAQSLVLRRDGSVWAWGLDASDGTGREPSRPRPVRIPGLAPVTAIAAGDWHCLALERGGSVVAWGRNAVGQLGDGTTTDRPTPVRVPDLRLTTQWRPRSADVPGRP